MSGFILLTKKKTRCVNLLKIVAGLLFNTAEEGKTGVKMLQIATFLVFQAENRAPLHLCLMETMVATRRYNACEKTTNNNHQPRKLLASEIKQDAAVGHFLQPGVYSNHI